MKKNVNKNVIVSRGFGAEKKKEKSGQKNLTDKKIKSTFAEMFLGPLSDTVATGIIRHDRHPCPTPGGDRVFKLLTYS